MLLMGKMPVQSSSQFISGKRRLLFRYIIIKLDDAYVAGTVAYIDDGNTKRKLVCTGLCRGTNTGFDMLDSNGNSISGRGGYAMYTCNSNWTDITIVFFS